MFQMPGIVQELPSDLTLAAQKREKWAQLVTDLMELVHEMYQHGLSLALPCDQLFTMLATRLRGVRYSKQEVQDAINLLTHPVFGCALGQGDIGISLAMNTHTLSQTLHSLADLLQRSG